MLLMMPDLPTDSVNGSRKGALKAEQGANDNGPATRKQRGRRVLKTLAGLATQAE